MIKHLIAFLIYVNMNCAIAQALPAYTPMPEPYASKVSQAGQEVIVQSGIAANDPRIESTKLWVDRSYAERLGIMSPAFVALSINPWLGLVVGVGLAVKFGAITFGGNESAPTVKFDMANPESRALLIPPLPTSTLNAPISTMPGAVSPVNSIPNYFLDNPAYNALIASEPSLPWVGYPDANQPFCIVGTGVCGTVDGLKDIARARAIWLFLRGGIFSTCGRSTILTNFAGGFSGYIVYCLIKKPVSVEWVQTSDTPADLSGQINGVSRVKWTGECSTTGEAANGGAVWPVPLQIVSNDSCSEVPGMPPLFNGEGDYLFKIAPNLSFGSEAVPLTSDQLKIIDDYLKLHPEIQLPSDLPYRLFREGWRMASIKPGYDGLPFDPYVGYSPPLTPGSDPTYYSSPDPAYVGDLSPGGYSPSSGGTDPYPPPSTPSGSQCGYGSFPPCNVVSGSWLSPADPDATGQGTALTDAIKTSPFQSWLGVTFTTNPGTCPTLSIPFFGEELTATSHCQVVEAIRPIASSIMSIIWVILAMFILLGA